jgi:hypothetical protein
LTRHAASIPRSPEATGGKDAGGAALSLHVPGREVARACTSVNNLTPQILIWLRGRPRRRLSHVNTISIANEHEGSPQSGIVELWIWAIEHREHGSV